MRAAVTKQQIHFCLPVKIIPRLVQQLCLQVVLVVTTKVSTFKIIISCAFLNFFLKILHFIFYFFICEWRKKLPGGNGPRLAPEAPDA